MSNAEQLGDAPNENEASRRAQILDIDWHLSSVTEGPIIAPSESDHSLLTRTALNTQANARGDTVQEDTVRPVLNSHNDVPFVRTPSPISLPSLSPRPLTARNNSNANSRRGSGIRSAADVRNDSDTRKESIPRKGLNSRKNSDLPPLPTTIAQQSLHMPDVGSPLNPAHSNERLRRSSQSHYSRIPYPIPGVRPTATTPSYPKMGVYATPQIFPAPLPIPQYMQPTPVDYCSIYPPSSQTQAFSIPPPLGIASPAPMPTYPTTRFPIVQPGTPVPFPSFPPIPRQSNSTSIVTTVAMTPELKTLAPIVDSRSTPDTGSFADNNPYNMRSLGRHERVTSDLRNPYPPIPPPLVQQPLYPRPQYAHYSGDMPSVGEIPTQPAWGTPVPVVIQDMPAASPPTFSQRRDSHDRRRSSHSWMDQPTQQLEGAYYPQRRKTAADVVSAATNMPILEKRRESFMENEAYRGSTPRRDVAIPIPALTKPGFLAEHDPYRIPFRRASVDLPTLPPRSRWDDMRRPPSSSQVSDRSDSDHCESDSSRRCHQRDGWDSEPYRPSHIHGRSSSLDYFGHSGSRPGWLRHSPLPQAPVAIPLPGQPFPVDAPPTQGIVPLPPCPIHTYPSEAYFRSSQKRGFWPRLSTLFKSPFERGRPVSLYNPYSESIDEPVGWLFIIQVIIGQIYFHLLLRLPSLYFSRVSRIFDEANLSLYEITEMVFETSGGPDPKEKSQAAMSLQKPETVAPKIRPQYKRLKNSWESFIDSLIHEWETFNIVSVMLLTAILTILQIGTAGSDPVTRYAALFSLMCALVSLLFGCMYIIRFGTMRKTYAAVEWAKSALGSSQSVIWNVWVLLSMPAVWLTWSIILFIVAMMSFVWRTNPANDAVSTFILSSAGLLIVRIAMSTVLGLGLINAMLITNTFRIYGEALDKDWWRWIDEWQKAKANEVPLMNLLTSGNIPLEGLQYLMYGQPLLLPAVPLVTPVPPPLLRLPSAPSIISMAPPFSTSCADLRTCSRRWRRGPIYSDSDSDSSSSTSTSSSSRSTPPRRKVRHRSRSSTRPPRNAGMPSRDPPTRSNMRSPRAQGKVETLPPLVSPIPRRPTRIKPPRADSVEAQGYHPDLYTNVLQGSGHNGDYIQESRVRFRSPLASAQESNDWDAYDSSFDNSAAHTIIAPSSAPASRMTHESSNVQIQNTELLRRRRPV